MDEHEQRELQSGGSFSSQQSEKGRGMVPSQETIPLALFFQTVVYRDFLSFCERCRRARNIGIGYGAAGVGKTLAVRAYTQWDVIESLLTQQGIMLPAALPLGLSVRGALYTLRKTTRPKELENDIALLQWSMQNIAKTLPQPEEEMQMVPDPWQLLFLDNVQYLDASLLDVVQNLYDRYRIGVILLGPPSLVESHALAWHPHLKTRIGRYYGFRLLSQAEIAPLVSRFVALQKLTVSPKSGAGLEWLVASIHLMTLGNVSLVCLLLDQVVEVLEGEKVPRVTEAVLQKAYRNLRWS